MSVSVSKKVIHVSAINQLSKFRPPCTMLSSLWAGTHFSSSTCKKILLHILTLWVTFGTLKNVKRESETLKSPCRLGVLSQKFKACEKLKSRAGLISPPHFQSFFLWGWDEGWQEIQWKTMFVCSKRMILPTRHFFINLFYYWKKNP